MADQLNTAARAWKLVRDIAEHWARFDPANTSSMRKLVHESGLRLGAIRALRHVPLDEPISLRDLADTLQCDKSYATVKVDELVRGEYATRTVDPTDRRSKLVELTASGRALAKTARELYAAVPTFLSELSVQELNNLVDILQSALATTSRQSIDADVGDKFSNVRLLKNLLDVPDQVSS